jgi:hypothetical protein
MTSRNELAKRSTAARAAATSSGTFWSRSESASPRVRALSIRRFSISSSRWFIAATSSRRRFGLSIRSSCRYGLRSTTQMSPSTSSSIRAERPVRRCPRSSDSTSHNGAPSRRMTISRSENDV